MELIPENFSYALPEDEKAAFSKLCRRPWTTFCVSGGDILTTESELHVYSVIQLIIESDVPALVAIDSEDVAETELCRMAIVYDEHKLDKMKIDTYPRFSELLDFPADLQIDQFLNIEIDVSIIRFNVEIEDGKGGVLGEAIVDSGLLISNVNGRMVLYSSLDIPLDIAITTDEAKITDILSKATNIEPLK